jgi:DivIVA domain-containing protein
VAFSKPRIGKRGYDEDEMDAFLDVVEAEIARVVEQNNQFRNQLALLDQQLRAVLICLEVT